MTCWMKFVGTVKGYLGSYNLNDQQAKEILLSIEKEVGHNPNLIRAIIDTEREGLIRRLKKKNKELELAYT